MNSCVVQMRRRLRHRGSAGAQPRVSLTLGWAATDSGIRWFEKDWSFFWRISWAVVGEEATVTLTEPKRRDIIGP